MREYRFDPSGELPIVYAVLKGPQGQKKVALVLDTGCALTQIDHSILSAVGCGEEKSIRSVSIGGVVETSNPAFVIELPGLRVLGERFTNPMIAGVDFSKWIPQGIDGLLGWDIVRQFHFDMDGPKGILRVF